MATSTDQQVSNSKEPAGPASTKTKSSRTGGRVITLPALPSLPSLPGLQQLSRQLSWLRPQIKLPPRDKMLLYAGLGAMAAIDLIDWPVALAIAAAQALSHSEERPLPEVSVHQARDRGASRSSEPSPSSSSSEAKPSRRTGSAS
jgi:hypothetical protein